MAAKAINKTEKDFFQRGNISYDSRLFLILVVGIILIFLNWRHKRKQIDEAWLGNADVLERWKYSPEERERFSEEYFPWIKNKHLAGEFSISDDSILISNGKDEFFRNPKLVIAFTSKYLSNTKYSEGKFC